MESLGFMDDLLDFPDLGEVVDEEDDLGKSSCSKAKAAAVAAVAAADATSLPDSASFDASSTPSLPEWEEELEWISNKDSFPSLESFIILPEQPGNNFKEDNLIPPLENSSSSSTTTSTHSSGNRGGTGTTTIASCCGGPPVPGRRARSKRARERRGDFRCFAATRLSREQEKASKKTKLGGQGSVKIGRKCLHCGSEKTPQWRAGPQGPKTLCNACGVRFKSGRLVPEYRPANSPTFSSEVHSNSHRKIIEMRRTKQMGGGGVKGVDIRVK